MRDTLPKIPHKNESCIINLDPVSKSGSHWVAFSKRGVYVYYFDSFGNLRPSKEVIDYLKNCYIRYNYHSYQTFNSSICGHLCLLFLYCINKARA